MDELGGVYLDTDQHIVQAFPKALNNVLGWQDDGNIVNGALMMFEKGGNVYPRGAEAIYRYCYT